MEDLTTSKFPWPLVIGVALLLGCWAGSPTLLQAQCSGTCAGDNAVYQSTTVVPSHSFIDASQLTGGSDICTLITVALQQLALAANSQYYNNEGVIDARGITNPSFLSNCTTNPWANLTTIPYSTVLLPAGTITTTATWVLPTRTRLIGQGSCLPNSGPCSTLTTIKASGLATEMIDMGGASFCPGSSQDCNGVAIEHLRLDGSGTASGIKNQYSQELSYVNDVAMINLNGTGLTVGMISSSTDGENSGPYSNLYISTAASCVQIKGLNQTRGVHGLTCNTVLPAGAAILLDSGNTTLEDITINYTPGNSPSGLDGIRVGSQAPAKGNVLMNILGSNLTNVIHISNQNGSSVPCPGSNGSNVCDLSILGVTAGGGNSILDDLSAATLSTANVGIYILGEQMAGTGISRFTTSTSVPTWFVGTQAPTGTCANKGALYSNTSGNAAALSACIGSAWSAIVSQ